MLEAAIHSSLPFSLAFKFCHLKSTILKAFKGILDITDLNHTKCLEGLELLSLKQGVYTRVGSHTGSCRQQQRRAKAPFHRDWRTALSSPIVVKSSPKAPVAQNYADADGPAMVMGALSEAMILRGGIPR
jgi:hypothetical protein